MKNKKMSLIIKVSIPIFIIGGCILVDRWSSFSEKYFSEKPVIVDPDTSAAVGDDKPLEIISKKAYGNVEGFSENLGFIGDNEALVGVGMTSDEFLKKYPNGTDYVNYDKVANDCQGQVYSLKLSNLDKKALGINTKDVISQVLPNVKKINYYNDKNYYIYDLNNAYGFKYMNNKMPPETFGNFSEDGNYLLGMENTEGIYLYNINKKTLKKINVRSNKLNALYSRLYSKDGKDIYFVGAEPKGKNSYRYGIFKVNTSTSQIDEVLVLPYMSSENTTHEKQSYISSESFRILNEGKKVIFDGIINGVSGIYVYDTLDKKFYDVVPNTVKSNEGEYGDAFWVSPDGSKVIYQSLALENNKEQWNLYAAKISGNKLTGKVCIYKNYNSAGAIDESVKWSGDSKSILFFSSSDAVSKNRFTFYNKNEVNVFTFK